MKRRWPLNISEEPWVPGRVDQLIEEIKKIQRECKHKFKVIEWPDLPESRVKSVFIAYDSADPACYFGDVKIKCRHCSVERKNSAYRLCLKCGAAMVKVSSPISRREYFKGQREDHTAFLFQCKNQRCDFQVVGSWRSWDIKPTSR